MTIKRPLIHDDGRIKEVDYKTVLDIGAQNLPTITSFNWDEQIILFRNGLPAALMNVLDFVIGTVPDASFRVVHEDMYVVDEADTKVTVGG